MSSLNEYGIIPLNEQYKEAEPEPVAWMVYAQDGKSVYVTDNPTDISGDQRALPLYTIQVPDESTQIARLCAKRDAWLYRELLMAVERKWPNETRHETALRYIRQAETPIGGPEDAKHDPIAQEARNE